MYKDKEKERAATNERVKRYRENQKALQEGVTLNESLVIRLASPIGEAKLRSICRCLNKNVAGVNLEGNKPVSHNLLDMVNYGIEHPTSLRTIHELLQ